jgi:NitT/TauT family transport system substrate-binding protein
MFLSTLIAWAGLDPKSDINWVVMPTPDAIPAFAQGKLDAFLAFPPAGQELRAKQVGHVILNSMKDKPWSQYYCCMPLVRKEFLQKNPVATKRALRAILKATDICAQHPERAAQSAVDRRVTDNYSYALDFFNAMPYSQWRDYDPVDTLTFYGNRLREESLIKSNANDIISRSTDWRFLNELKQELPAPAPSAGTGGLVCRVA